MVTTHERDRKNVTSHEFSWHQLDGGVGSMSTWMMAITAREEE